MFIGLKMVQNFEVTHKNFFDLKSQVTSHESREVTRSLSDFKRTFSDFYSSEYVLTQQTCQVNIFHCALKFLCT